MTSASILVVPSLDGSVATAFAAARRVAPSMRARVTVLEVLPDRRGHRGGVQVALAQSRGTEDRTNWSVAREPRLLVRFGDRHEEIEREVLEGGHGLVIAQVDPGHRQAAAALALVRSCPSNVWVVRPAKGDRHGVVAVVDPSPETAFFMERPHDPSRDHAVLSVADRVAGALAEPLTVFHAWRAVGENLLRTRGRVATADLRRYVTEVGVAHHLAVAALVASHRFRTEHPVVRVVKGHPALTPAHHHATANASLLVVPASSTELVRDAECSVLVVRHEVG